MRKRQPLGLLLLISFLLSFSTLTPSTFADDTYVGVLFPLYASANSNNHNTFYNDFKSFVDELVDVSEGRNINTIVFSISNKRFHWQCDNGLANLTYPAGGGFTAAEVQNLVAYARSNGLKIVVSTDILTHLEDSAFAEAYPGYMINEGAWASSTVYTATKSFVENGGTTYRCKSTHTSSAATEPGVGASWSSYWVASNRSLRDPFDGDGEDLMFDMIDELITAFTLYGTKPEAFNLESDEAYSWLKVSTGALTFAETYAMVMNDAYDHITNNNPSMDVMMWADMLDPVAGGAEYQTAEAIDDIDTDIILIDWRYDLAWYRYDFDTGLFPSVKELTDEGFSVITAGWNDTDATAALIWTGNMAEADGDTILGHIYTVWSSSYIPYITSALNGSTGVKQELVEVAAAINNTWDLIGATQCAQNDTSWGTYPNCSNANDSDGIYGTDYRDYYYDSGLTYSTISLPLEPVSYWDFEGDADDRYGSNDGTLTNGASIVTDNIRGQVVNLDGTNDYVSVPDDATLDMTDELTVSCWIKLDVAPADYTERMVPVGKHYTEYEITLFPRGQVNTLSYSDNASGYDGMATYNKERTWETGRWYHVAWAMDGDTEYVYVDGELVGTRAKDYEGTEGSTNDFTIGRRATSGGLYFDGRIDDVMVFDSALSPAEIKYLHLTQEIPAPIGYWDFEGDADDRVGNNDGTLAGTAYLDEDIERYNEEVLVLDGDSDYVSCGTSPEFSLTGSRTISAWIKPDDTREECMMIAGRYYWGYSLNVIDGKLRGYVRGSTTSASSWASTATITEDEWQHVAMTFDIDGDKQIHLYRNGEEVSYGTLTAMVGTPENPGTIPFSIGVDYYFSQYYFSGSIDNIKLFDFALSPDQIKVQYQLGGGPSLYSDLFAQNQVEESIRLDLKLDESSGTTAYDDSSYGNDGTVTGSNWSWVTGISGNAFDIFLASADAYINIGYVASLELDGSRSISAWIKPDSNPAANCMIACKSIWGYSLYTNAGQLRGYVGGSTTSAQSYSSSSIITVGEWQHVMMTFDVNGDKKIHLYRNGIEVASYGAQTTLVGSPRDNSSYKFRVGADHYTRYFFDGKIDQVKVFNRALTPRQVIYYYLNSDI